MTNSAPAAWAHVRRDVLAAIYAGAADQLARLTWDADRIRQEQHERMRVLLDHAAEHSPFHRQRLAGINFATVDPDDLSALPVMTKGQMMAAFDDVLTDRRLNSVDIESALASTGTEPVPLLDEYIALASGGCSGRRGVFVLDRAAVASFAAAVARQPRADDTGSDAAAAPPRMAFVTAPAAVHATGMVAALMTGADAPGQSDAVPATLSLGEIVERLNVLQPPTLVGYASMLVRLAAEARAGRLRISPAQVNSTSETLLPEMRAEVRRTFGVPVLDGFGSTEGLVGRSLPDDDVFVFNTDMCIVELVDGDNRPVPPGVPSAKVLVTNLYNMAQPLIRYELTDTFIAQPEAVEHGYLRARVEGRTDDVLRYDTVGVHPITVRSVMVKTPEVIDYQVRQTPSGIDVYTVTTDGCDVDDLVRRLRNALVETGLDTPEITVRRVERLDRHPVSGKLRRFLPLPAASDGDRIGV